MPQTSVRQKLDASRESKKNTPKGSSGSNAEKPFDLKEYFKGVRQEWSKITWPPRTQVIAETGVVLVVVTLFSLFVFVIDKVFQLVIQAIT